MEAMGDREEKQSVSEQIETKTEEKQTWKAQDEGNFERVAQNTAKSLKQESGINQVEMARADAIAAHPLWRKSVVCITQLEASREFCRHDVTHFLDVARVAWIENLERGLGVSKEEIYVLRSCMISAVICSMKRASRMTRQVCSLACRSFRTADFLRMRKNGF